MEKIEKNFILEKYTCFDVELSLFCGQAFRWSKKNDGSFHGVVGNKIIDIEKENDRIIFKNVNDEETERLIKRYFDLERDYKKICEKLCGVSSFAKAFSEYEGIRILRQDSWEALCSFIISQNNNIPRISGIIERLCKTFCEKINDEDYSFPSFEKLNSGEISLDEIEKMPIEQARQELCKIKGVGAKVAECTLLYGFGRIEAFPVDVWVKRIMQEMYPDG